jgi:hypothetical protein
MVLGLRAVRLSGAEGAPMRFDPADVRALLRADPDEGRTLMTWMTLDPDDVVTLAEAVGVDPYGKSARRLREEVIAGFERAFSRHPQRASGRSGVASGERHSGTGAVGGRGARELADEEAALGDAWLTHHGLEPLPGDDGRGRAYLRYEPGEDARDAPYSPDGSGDEEAFWRAHAANLSLAEDERL